MTVTRHDDLVRPGMPMGAQLGRIAEELTVLARVQDALRELYTSVLGQDLGLTAVLRQVVTTAVDLVDARYGVLGVLSDDCDHLVEFLPVGLSEEEEAAAAPLGWPNGRGLLAHLREDSTPLRVSSISDHPMAIGLPPGHPEVRTLLGVTIVSRGHTFGNLYVSDRRDGQPFDQHDETMIVALAGAAGLAIDHARLFGQVRGEAEEFQRLLLPQLPDLRPIEAAALYRPATAGRIGGDWYDAVRLSGGSCAVVIGDVGGHSMQAAAEMSQIRAMLRALLYERHGSPSAILTRLDRMLQATNDTPITTACLGVLQPADSGWRLHWSTAGHPAPLLLEPRKPGRYLDAEPGPPLGVDYGTGRPDHRERLPGGATLVFFTDGLVEQRAHNIDEGLATLAQVATRHTDPRPQRLCQALADGCPSDGSDDIAIMALKLPALPARVLRTACGPAGATDPAASHLGGHVPKQFGVPGVEGVLGDAGPEQAGAFGPGDGFADVLEVAPADSLGERGGGQEHRGCRALLHRLAALGRGFQASGVLLEPGGDGAGIDGVGIYTFARPAPGRLDREQNHRGLGLGIGLPRVIGAEPEVHVTEHDRAVQVRIGAQRDDPRPARRRERRAEPGRQREVAQVVGGELQLMALRAAGQLRHGHDPGVVDQDVQWAAPARGHPCRRLQVGQVQQDRLDLRVAGRRGDPLGRVAAGRAAAGGHHNGRARAGQRAGGLVADPGVRPRHQRGLARQVDPLQDVTGGAVEPERRDQPAHRCASRS
jgi:Stage II sporulation protein E (SpoIIE)/GAF domain